MNELNTLSLLAIRNKLACGDVTPSEVVSASLQRIRETEPQLNACITVLEEEALLEAKALDAQAGTKDAKTLPLWGVPVTVKDLFCTKGVKTTCGSKMLEQFTPPYNAFVVEQLKKAGAIIIAKTNMDEFAMGSGTQFSAFGKTSNPWDCERVPGGSSGGSAASVAAMQAYASLGSDTGGSIRQPAGLCGCVGIKPTYGRVSRYGTVAYASSFDQAGPLARTVEDCAHMLSVIAGYDPKDSSSANIPVPSFTESLSRRDMKGLTLGLPKEYWDQSLSEEVKVACHSAVQKAKDLGATIVDVSLPSLVYSVATYYILSSAEASTNLARFDGVRFGYRAETDEGLLAMYTASRSEAFGQEVKRRILLGGYVLSAGYYDAYYTKASKVRRLILNDYENAFQTCDALLAPVCPITAWGMNQFTDDPLTCYIMDMMTLSLNLAGLPGMSVPVGLGKDSGLPVGMQIIGKAFDESGILGIANTLEHALPALGIPSGI